MADKYSLFSTFYKCIAKPVLFSFQPELVHDCFTQFARTLGGLKTVQSLTAATFDYRSDYLNREVLGLKLLNPVGLAAGYDYDGHFVRLMTKVGFGFNTVGTVTNIPYEGNPKPRFVRLIKSKSLLVNKGFKSDGVDKVSTRLADPALKDVMFGVSVGSSNVPQIDSISKAIDDAQACFVKLESSPYIKYYELNISCPNLALSDSYSTKQNIGALLEQISRLRLARPVFIKMESEADLERDEFIVNTALSLGIRGFIFSNLVKSRENRGFNSAEIAAVDSLSGSFSGKPTSELSNNKVRHFRAKYGSDIVIVGCGGIFSPQDAEERLNSGADLVQLITGMIFEGPQLIAQINKHLAGQAAINYGSGTN